MDAFAGWIREVELWTSYFRDRRKAFSCGCVSVTLPSQARKCLFARSTPMSKLRTPELDLQLRNFKTTSQQLFIFSFRLYIARFLLGCPNSSRLPAISQVLIMITIIVIVIRNRQKNPAQACLAQPGSKMSGLRVLAECLAHWFRIEGVLLYDFRPIFGLKVAGVQGVLSSMSCLFSESFLLLASS